MIAELFKAFSASASLPTYYDANSCKNITDECPNGNECCPDLQCIV